MSLSRQDRGLVLDGAGYRSPNGNVPQYQGTTSPAGQGRSVREFEEQMLSLRKENFNLKLRLYFLEENVPGYQHSKSATPDEPETLVKQLIDAKVEMEMLRKDIAEKQDILKEAAQAMNQMEKIQKDTEEKSGNIITELHQKISTLEAERIDKWNSVDFSNPECLSTLQKVRELEENANGFEERYLDLQAQVKSMSEGLAKRDETIKEYEDKVRELVIQNAELQEQLEARERQVKQAENWVHRYRQNQTDLKEDNTNLHKALRAAKTSLSRELINMRDCQKQMRLQQESLSMMQSKISTKTLNASRMLTRLQDYEKMVTKMAIEQRLVKRENYFFRDIITKMQSRTQNCKPRRQPGIYSLLQPTSMQNAEGYNWQYYQNMPEEGGDFNTTAYHVEEKVSVNIHQRKCVKNPYSTTAFSDIEEEAITSDCSGSAGDCCHHGCHNLCCSESDNECCLLFPMRRVCSENSVRENAQKPGSICSIHETLSSTSFYSTCNVSTHQIPASLEQEFVNRVPNSTDGIGYVYKKFGNCHC